MTTADDNGLFTTDFQKRFVKNLKDFFVKKNQGGVKNIFLISVLFYLPKKLKLFLTLDIWLENTSCDLPSFLNTQKFTVIVLRLSGFSFYILLQYIW